MNGVGDTFVSTDSTDGDIILETFVHPRILEVGHIEVWTGRDDYYNYNHKKSLSSFDLIFQIWYFLKW